SDLARAGDEAAQPPRHQEAEVEAAGRSAASVGSAVRVSDRSQEVTDPNGRARRNGAPGLVCHPMFGSCWRYHCGLRPAMRFFSIGVLFSCALALPAFAQVPDLTIALFPSENPMPYGASATCVLKTS